MRTSSVSLVVIFLVLLTSCKKNEENPIVYQSTLSTSDPAWYAGSGNGVTCGFNQGKYEISVISPGAWGYADVPINSINYQYSISVDASIQLADIDEDGYCGVLFNFIDLSNYSAFIFTPGGEFAIFEYFGGTYSMPVNWTQTNALKTGSGSVNTIQLSQSTSSVKVVINNIVINTYSLNIVPNCAVAVYAQSDRQNFTSMVGTYNNVVVKKL